MHLFCKTCRQPMVHLGSNKFQCCNYYCPTTRNITLFEKPSPIMCENCGEREATMTWLEEGGTLGLVHGMGQNWCELCCVREQLLHAEKQIARLPELKKRLKELEEEDND